MRGDAFADASPTRGIATCNPHGFVGNRLIEAVLAGAGGEQVEPRLAPTPVLALCSRAGLRGKSRSLPPLHSTTRMIMRSTASACGTVRAKPEEGKGMPLR